MEAFVAVAEELHFRKAAERLHVTPSRVSQAVRTLERRVGRPLFVRTSRRVRLTPLGEQLLADFRPALARLTSGLREVQRAGQTALPEPLRLVVTNSLRAEVPHRLFTAFMREYPDTTLVRTVAPTLSVRDWLTEDQDGLLLTWFPCEPAGLELPARVQTGPAVLHEPRAVLVSVEHPLATRQTVDVEELADYDVINPIPDPGELGVAYAEAWVPPSTPAGRPIRRLSRGDGRFLESLFAPIITERLVHVTIASIGENFGFPQVAVVPLTGWPPFLLVPVWSTARETSSIPAFVDLALRVGEEQGWLG